VSVILQVLDFVNISGTAPMRGETRMPGRLDGKVAILTGTGRGIARAVALRFAAEGASVLGCDLDPQSGQETVDMVRGQGGTMESLHPLDLMDENDVQRLMDFALERFGGIDILFNSARGHRPGTIEDTSLADWRWTLDHTLGIQFVVTKYAIPHFKARGRGSIIFVASISGLPLGTGFPGNANGLLPYSVAKSGVIRLAIGLAHELAPAGIRVNAISPGNILSGERSPFYGEQGLALRRAAERSSLMERLGTPEEIGSAALFLASEEASFITGHNLLVDGGFSASGGLGRGNADDDSPLSTIVARNIAASGQTGRTR
jgi:meso-butanediol dehydrogenase / (S,S)-butanediol dehydrogenase / diacetyl reductase